VAAVSQRGFNTRFNVSKQQLKDAKIFGIGFGVVIFEFFKDKLKSQSVPKHDPYKSETAFLTLIKTSLLALDAISTFAVGIAVAGVSGYGPLAYISYNNTTTITRRSNTSNPGVYKLR
jgi:hypothetical protein